MSTTMYRTRGWAYGTWEIEERIVDKVTATRVYPGKWVTFEAISAENHRYHATYEEAYAFVVSQYEREVENCKQRLSDGQDRLVRAKANTLANVVREPDIAPAGVRL